MLSSLRKFVNYDSKVFGLLGVFPPNIWTFITLVFSMASGLLYYEGLFLWGALFFALSGVSDVIDGGVARHFHAKTKYGAVLDATTDRIGEGLVFLGMMKHYPIAGLALVFSYAVSYIRAKDDRIRVGIAERSDRIFFIVAATFINQLEAGLYFVTLTVAVTVFMRLREAKRLYRR